MAVNGAGGPTGPSERELWALQARGEDLERRVEDLTRTNRTLELESRAVNASLQIIERVNRQVGELQTVSTEEWANPNLAHFPPYPAALRAFLQGNCSIWRGKKRSETHIVVPLFPTIRKADGTEVPRTLASLHELDKAAGGTGYDYIWDKIPQNTPAEGDFHWAVMTKDVLPNSRKKTYDQHLAMAQAKGYEMPPRALDAATAILWQNRYAKSHCFPDSPWTYTRCQEKMENYALVVGGFSLRGLRVHTHHCDYVHGRLGVAGWRKF